MDRELIMRPPALADAEAVADGINANALEWTGAPFTDADKVRSWWSEPGFDLEARARLVEGEDGIVAGSLQVFARPPYTEAQILLDVHPQHRGRGIAEALAELGEQMAHEATAAAPVGRRRVARVPIWCGETPLAELLAARGHSLVRTFWLMVVDHDEPPPAPVWSEGVALRPFDRERDVRALYDAHCEAFADHWGESHSSFESWVHRHIDSAGADYDPALWFLAWSGDELAGFSICKPSLLSDPASGDVAQLGVRRAFRNRGIGRALLYHSFRAYWQRGLRRVSLFVDSDSLTGATRLYESVGMRPVPRFEIWDKELAPAGARPA